MCVPQFICVEHGEMSMLRVLKAKEKAATPYTKLKPSSVIESANVVVHNVILRRLKGSGSRKRIKYRIYNPL